MQSSVREVFFQSIYMVFSQNEIWICSPFFNEYKMKL